MIGAAALLLASALGQAATMVELGADEMVARSQAIVMGEVVSTASRLQGRFIVTDVTIRLDRAALKGNLQVGQTLTLTELGGEVDGLGMRVSGAPVYRLSDRVAVFASTRSDGSYRTLGLSQGLFRIQGGDVVRDLAAEIGESASDDTDAASAEMLDAETLTEEAARFPDHMGLGEFIGRVDSLVRAQKAVQP
jgi:hypothetical protein